MNFEIKDGHDYIDEVKELWFYNKCWGKTDFHSSALPQFS